MEKVIRKAVRCYLIRGNEVVVIKYKNGNRREGYYDIPGGKIEKNELSNQTAIREMKEETGMDVKNLQYKGIMTIEYPDRIYIFDIFIAKEYGGEPQNSLENTSEWITINKLLQSEKILSNIMILDRFFIKGLIEDCYHFNMYIMVDEKENILDVKYSLEESSK